MEQYAGIDVSLECSSVCVVDGSGKIVREAVVPSEPEALILARDRTGQEPTDKREQDRPYLARTTFLAPTHAKRF
jgi:hypothetical protein